MLHDVARRWANKMLTRSNDSLRRELIRAEAAEDRLSQMVERLRARRALDRDVRVQAEQAAMELTRANLVLSGLLAEKPVPDPVAVEACLRVRAERGEVHALAQAAYLAADGAYREALAEAMVGSSGPEYLRKAEADRAAAGLRAARDVAEVERLRAADGVRLAELALRAASAGVGEVAEAPGDRDGAGA